ncbi:MAG: TRAP transporter large permease [Pseudomonadota bacterium]
MVTIGTIAIGFFVMLGLMLTGLHVATVMFATSILGLLVFFGPSILAPLGNMMWSELNSFILTAIPLYVLMGELLVRSGIAERMYNALALWMHRLPGGLLHTNVASSTMFAAISGSSVATAATIGTVAFPTFRAQGYEERWVAGSIASGATLGILIPPSINFIIYGAISETSIGDLFLAGFVPGLLLAMLFMGTIAVAAVLRPQIAGRPDTEPSMAERLRKLVDLVPPLFIFVMIVGSIYQGWATPTEAAAVGVVAALLLAALNRRLSFAMLHVALLSTVRITAMMLLILTTAFFLNFSMGLMGIPNAISSFITDLNVGPLTLIACLVLLYLALGCFLDSLAMMIATMPI